MAYQYLFPPTTQFQARTGANLTAGYLRVYYTQTDDRAPTYSDFFGTENQDDIVLDNDGRAVVIVDDTKTYRLEVYTYNGACLFTIDPLSAVGGGGGSGLASVTKIISTDGTVQITTTTSAGTTYFDLSTALSPEASKWGTLFGARSVITGDGTWDEIPVITSLGTETYQNGWVVNKDTGYDIAASIEMVSGSSVATKLVEVRFDTEIDGNVVHSQYATIDPSRNIDKASFEWKGDVTEGQIVNGRIFVSSTEALSLGLVSNVLFNEECDGVIGGAGTTYEAGQYVDIDQGVISVTGVQPSGDYTYNSAFSSVQTGLVDLSSTVSGLTGTYIEQSASGLFQPSGNYLSSTESSNYLLTSQSSLFQSAGNYQTAGDYAFNSALSAYIPISSSGEFAPSGDYAYNSALTAYQPSGDYAYNSAVSSKLDTTAFSTVSGDFLTSHQSLAGYATESYVDSSVSGKLDATACSQFLTSLPDDLAYTSDVASAVSGKLDASASSDFYPATSNPSGYLTAHQSLAGYATETYVDSAVSGKLDSSAYDSAQFYSTSNPSGFITGVDLSNYATTSYVDSSVSGKLDASASSTFYTTANESGFITGVDLTPYQLTADMSGYISTSESSNYYSTSNPSGFITGVDLSDYATTAYVDSSVSGKFDASASGEFYTTGNPSGFITGVDLSNYATTAYVDSSVSSKLDATASGDFYSTSNPSGFITGVDLSNYATTSYVESSVSGKQDASAMTGYIPTSESSNYQTTAGMAAYQPSGDYIYASALGTGEI